MHRNQQYSITALTDGGGTITERYAYSAYGTPTITNAAGTTRTSSADNNRYTYTGREYDEALVLYHYRTRMYDSVAGRFCSRDPIGYWDGASMYRAYFGLSSVDPGGLSRQVHEYIFRVYSGGSVREHLRRMGVHGPRLGSGCGTDIYSELRERFPDCVVVAAEGQNCSQHYANCKSGCEDVWWFRRDDCVKECKRARRCCDISVDARVDTCIGLSPIDEYDEEHGSLGCKNELGDKGPRIRPGEYDPDLH